MRLNDQDTGDSNSAQMTFYPIMQVIFTTLMKRFILGMENSMFPQLCWFRKNYVAPGEGFLSMFETQVMMDLT